MSTSFAAAALGSNSSRSPSPPGRKLRKRKAPASKASDDYEEEDEDEDEDEESSQVGQATISKGHPRFKNQKTAPVPGKKRRFVLNDDGSRKKDSTGKDITARGGGKYVIRRMRRHEYLLWSLNWFGNNPNPMTKEQLAREAIAATNSASGQTLDANNKADLLEMINLYHVHERGDVKKYMDGRLPHQDVLKERARRRKDFVPTGKLVPWGTWTPGDPFQRETKGMLLPSQSAATATNAITAKSSGNAPNTAMSAPIARALQTGSMAQMEDSDEEDDDSGESGAAESMSSSSIHRDGSPVANSAANIGGTHTGRITYTFEAPASDALREFRAARELFRTTGSWGTFVYEQGDFLQVTLEQIRNNAVVAGAITDPAIPAATVGGSTGLSAANVGVVGEPAVQHGVQVPSANPIADFEARDPSQMNGEEFQEWVRDLSDEQLALYLTNR